MREEAGSVTRWAWLAGCLPTSFLPLLPFPPHPSSSNTQTHAHTHHNPAAPPPVPPPSPPWVANMLVCCITGWTAGAQRQAEGLPARRPLHMGHQRGRPPPQPTPAVWAPLTYLGRLPNLLRKYVRLAPGRLRHAEASVIKRTPEAVE